METSQKLTLVDGMEQWTLFPEGSLVSRTAKQENDSEKRMNATCGPKCLEQFARFPRATSWAKTFAGLLIGTTAWYSTKCKLTWKLKGTKSNRFYFQLQVSTPPTEETASGLLPTVKAMEAPSSTHPRKPESKYKPGDTLTDKMIKGMLPTPKLLKTPAAADAHTERMSKKEFRFGNSGTLAQEVVSGFVYQRGLLPTPNASDHPGKNTGKRNQDSIPKRIREAGGQTSQLNPRFVAEMMGFPPNWTELPFQSGETKV